MCDGRSQIDGWPGEQANRLVERRWPDGSLFLAIDHHPDAGYRIHAPGYGEHVVSSDGGDWVGTVSPAPVWQWQKLLAAQVLPTIATLQGLEPLHASAVAIDGRVYGLIAPSGIGKSSTATHLIARGAHFFTDDVLALEQTPAGLFAHPGLQLANVHRHELDVMSASARARLGRLLGVSDKCHLAPSGVGDRLPLGGLVFLARGGHGSQVRIQPSEGDPALLLGSAFSPHVISGSRLRRQLAVCAAVASDVPLWTMTCGPEASAGTVAEVLWRRLLAVASA